VSCLLRVVQIRSLGPSTQRPTLPLPSKPCPMIPDPYPHSVHLDAGTGTGAGVVAGVGVGVDLWGEYHPARRCPELVTMPTGAR
jgi:hypothetical protein